MPLWITMLNILHLYPVKKVEQNEMSRQLGSDLCPPTRSPEEDKNVAVPGRSSWPLTSKQAVLETSALTERDCFLKRKHPDNTAENEKKKLSQAIGFPPPNLWEWF